MTFLGADEKATKTINTYSDTNSQFQVSCGFKHGLTDETQRQNKNYNLTLILNFTYGAPYQIKNKTLWNKLLNQHFFISL